MDTFCSGEIGSSFRPRPDSCDSSRSAPPDKHADASMAPRAVPTCEGVRDVESVVAAQVAAIGGTHCNTQVFQHYFQSAFVSEILGLQFSRFSIGQEQLPHSTSTNFRIVGQPAVTEW